MREIRFRFKLARKRGRGGAYIISVDKRWKRFKIPLYWQIILTYGGYACPDDENEYIKCINHEIMHGILSELVGEDANFGWDNILKAKYDENYGWKNIIGKWLPDVYCEED